jgi:hypothetical protein
VLSKKRYGEGYELSARPGRPRATSKPKRRIDGEDACEREVKIRATGARAPWFWLPPVSHQRQRCPSRVGRTGVGDVQEGEGRDTTRRSALSAQPGHAARSHAVQIQSVKERVYRGGGDADEGELKVHGHGHGRFLLEEQERNAMVREQRRWKDGQAYA